jgi:hypothetical protein
MTFKTEKELIDYLVDKRFVFVTDEGYVLETEDSNQPDKWDEIYNAFPSKVTSGRTTYTVKYLNKNSKKTVFKKINKFVEKGGDVDKLIASIKDYYATTTMGVKTLHGYFIDSELWLEQYNEFTKVKVKKISIYRDI